ncbi:universal stress protein [Intrasporangium sp.]|uniref:universal stress protein n=1 Tax=Intrasporangium sp. TaxID=1925024 RepID=UPI00293A8E85|nr:universal stress protein [Intrasporangium sp.]MDV3221820.1 universal stress protein [Intrasporangium sp.]
MDGTRIALVLTLWVAIGLVTGLWMTRRGHDAWWTAIAVVLGPLFVPIALSRVERQPRVAETGPDGSPGSRAETPGGPRVLVGLDGSEESQSALDRALDVLGDHYGVLVLAEVVSYDANEETQSEPLDRARERLASAADRLGRPRVNCEVLAGPPAEALRAYAVEEDMDLVVVGRRGRGLSDLILGSVSSELIRHSCIPVLVVDCTDTLGSADAPEREQAQLGDGGG